MSVRAFLFAGLTAIALGGVARAQGVFHRGELAWRLQALEGTWQAADREGREAALPRITAAVQGFFALDFESAAGELDAARAVLAGGAPLAGVRVRALNRIVGGALQGALAADLPTLLVERSGPATEGLTLEVRWEAGDRVLGKAWVQPGGKCSLPVPGDLEPADSIRRVRGVLVGRLEEYREERALEFVWVPGPRSRLAVLRSRVAALASSKGTFGHASAAILIDLLEDLDAGHSPEVELPFAAWMTELERRLDALESGQPWMDSSQAGDHLIALPGRRRLAPARLFLPPGLEQAGPTPLVIALHGAGGSEHMFFEAYGNGRLVELARERGWMVVSPGLGKLDVAGLLSALTVVLPVDLERVALVGHSMGALAGLGAAERVPGSIAALVAMGGGRSPGKVAALAELPIHVAVGEHDFGRRGGEALHAALAGSERRAELELHLVRGAEHLMVVQDGLGRAFAFLDRALE